ncbi:MAG: sulfotransferase family 2 domain-containing protein [Acidimicrobiales bacterium]
MFEAIDGIVNTQPLRSNARTALGRALSVMAELTPRPKEQLRGDFDRIYFHHVRKTAGTSLVFAFFSLSGADPHSIERRLFWCSFARVGGVRFVEGNPALIQEGRYFFAASHFPSYVARPPRHRTFEFTVLRDPVKRVVSLYRYLRSAESDNGFIFKAPANERAWADGSFRDFLARVRPEDLLRQLYMFSPVGDVSETVDVLGNLNLVMRTESIESGVESLREMTGISLDVGHKRTTLASEEIEPEELEEARERLEPEYEMLRQIEAT